MFNRLSSVIHIMDLESTHYYIGNYSGQNGFEMQCHKKELSGFFQFSQGFGFFNLVLVTLRSFPS